MNQLKLRNYFTLEEAVGRAAVSLATHPLDYVKILIQLGFEPMSPYPTRTIFGRHRIALPGCFAIMRYIRNQDGFFGLYRGCGYKLAAVLVNGFAYINANQIQKAMCPEAVDDNNKEDTESEGLNYEKINRHVKTLLRETTSRFIASTLSYPFQLITIRTCAQFIGRETIYDSMFGAVIDIYKTNGTIGFYAGFVPRFLGDCLILWMSQTAVLLLSNYVGGDSTVKGYLAASINFVVASFLYPFQLVSTIMCCNGSSAQSLVASEFTGPEYIDWLDCWNHLSALGQLKRGSSTVFRYHVLNNSIENYTYPYGKSSRKYF